MRSPEFRPCFVAFFALLALAVLPRVEAQQNGFSTNVFTTNATYGIYQIKGTNNLTVISNGGVVATTSAGGIWGGVGSVQLNNTILISGPGSAWSNNAGTTTFRPAGNATSDTNVLNRLIISNGATLMSGTVDTTAGQGLGSMSNTFTVIGSDSLWTNGRTLNIGSSSPFNRLEILDGGAYRSGSTSPAGLLIGSGAAGYSNVLLVSSGQVAMSTAGTAGMSIGSGSFGNLATFSNGASFSALGAVVVGSAFGGDGNTLIVVGSNTTFTAGNLTVGSTGGGSNLLFAADGAQLSVTRLVAGSAASNTFSMNNKVVLTGSNTLLVGSGSMGIGDAATNSFGNQILVTNGARTATAGIAMGIAGGGGGGNLLLVDGKGSAVSSTGGSVRYSGTSNTIMAANNGLLVIGGTDIQIGSAAGSSNNTLVVAGGAVLTNTSGALRVGYVGFQNALVISNGGRAFSSAGTFTVGDLASSRASLLWVADGGVMESTAALSLGATAGSESNQVRVTGPGSRLAIGGALTMGPGGNGLVVISNGGAAAFGGASLPLGSAATSSNNLILVSDSGSSLTNAGNLNIGGAGSFNNTLVVSNGGLVVLTNAATGLQVGMAAGSTSNQVLVTGAGSTLRVLNKGVYVGSNTTTKGTLASVIVENGGLLEANTIVSGSNNTGTITFRNGGILQFATVTPNINQNTDSSIAMNNAILSYANVMTNVFMGRGMSNLVWSGNNGIMLNNATNTVVAGYTFDSLANTGNSTNFQKLLLAGAAPTWRSTSLTLGAGGELIVTNTANASILGTFTNGGAVRTVNSTATFASNVVVGGGTFTLRNGTNTFLGGLALATNSLLGGSGRIASTATINNAGTISPGNSPGTLTFSSNLTLLDSSLLVLEIAGTNSADYDHLVVEGVFSKDGSVLVTNLGYNFVGGETFDFVDAAGLSGNFASWILPTLSGGMQWDTSDFEDLGILSVMAIPEPSSFLALGGGALLLALLRRRR